MEYAKLLFEIVPDYESKNLICAKCGETHNVRYRKAEYKGMDVCYCDNCMVEEMMTGVKAKSRTTRKTSNKTAKQTRQTQKPKFKSEADYENYMEYLACM